VFKYFDDLFFLPVLAVEENIPTVVYTKLMEAKEKVILLVDAC